MVRQPLVFNAALECVTLLELGLLEGRPNSTLLSKRVRIDSSGVKCNLCYLKCMFVIWKYFVSDFRGRCVRLLKI